MRHHPYLADFLLRCGKRAVSKRLAFMCLNDGYIPAEHMETDPGENSNFFYDYFFSKMYSTGMKVFSSHPAGVNLRLQDDRMQSYFCFAAGDD